jgi:hypothetical protein
MTYVILTSAAFAGVVIFLVILGLILILRWWIKSLDEPVIMKRNPRVQTRIQQSPIETEIADAIARDLPPNKRAKFVA